LTKVWLVSGTTESGDDWFLVFKNEPTTFDIERQIRSDNWLREEYEADCIQGWNVTLERVID
jgi:hypothetical protein